jgi:hypothetical protein
MDPDSDPQHWDFWLFTMWFINFLFKVITNLKHLYLYIEIYIKKI